MHRVLNRLSPLALVLVCLPAAPVRADGPAKTLGELDDRAASARLREYVNEEPALGLVKALQEQTDCNAGTLFFDHGVPVWLYIPRSKSIDRKLVEDSFRALLEQALVKDFEPLLDPAAAAELRARARIQEWRVTKDLKELDSALARLWVSSYLREMRTALPEALRDRVVLDPNRLRFADGKPTWTVVTPAGKRLSAEEKALLAVELRKLLVQALGQYRGGLLGQEASKRLENEALRGDEWILQPPEPAPAPRLPGSGLGTGPEGPPMTGLDDQVRLMKLELSATRQQVRELQEELQRLATLVRNQGGSSAAAAPQGLATAQFTVRLPAAARLWVNDTPCPLTSDTRSFQSPPLPAGKEYAYTLRAIEIRGNRELLVQKKVVFTTGKQTDVDLRPDFAALTPRGEK
jgi:uncharacterized protein (TIGR03000 family)